MSMFEELPECEEEFRELAYWNKFYAVRGERAFEWYVPSAEFARLVMEEMRGSEKDVSGARLVNLGCGTCAWPMALQALAPGVRVVSVDTSEEAVARARRLPGADGAGLEFRVEDALRLESIADESVDAVVDKGLVDALHPAIDATSRRTMRELADAVGRVLTRGGLFLVVSLLQPHVRSLVQEAFAPDWHVTLRLLTQGTSKHAPFLLTLRKHKDATGDADWADAWALADGASPVVAPKKPATLALVSFKVGLRGAAAADQDAVDRLARDVARLDANALPGFRQWRTPPAVHPLAFGLRDVRAVALLDADFHDGAAGFKRSLAAALGARDDDDDDHDLSDDDSSSSDQEKDHDDRGPTGGESGESGAGEEQQQQKTLPFRVAPPEILHVAFGSSAAAS